MATNGAIIGNIARRRFLDISNNRLTKIGRERYAELTTLDAINLHGNPWECHCDHLPMLVWITQSKVLLKS